ncbi:DUF421 domain-containing protein [Clostridium sp. D2Q-11]|uniref:DUF421 domain-containing protein n=1 Tax=Anaeromonas frigoriresistens TaxID=2683708 RepID=A0A942Z9F2_9FIRM|nr:YetF domain-containing protein [Anaeromonas frigoriresistens]MBS4539258.1 DUF421 domain-containing protein [Anaeromonas frigoriresistens]
MIKLVLIFFLISLIIFIIKPKKFTPYTSSVQLPLILVKNGSIVNHNLYAIKKDENWLNNTLNKKGIYNLSNIEQAIILTTGILDVQLYSKYEEKRT